MIQLDHTATWYFCPHLSVPTPAYSLPLLMLSRHVVTFEEETADHLKQDDFVTIVGVHLEELIVAF